MVIRSDKMGQSWLLPPAVTDLIPEDHISHLVVAVVNSIDISGAEQKYRFTPGNPAYSRQMLPRLVIMASVDAIWSSRKIAKLARENVVYMYLTGHEKPDFRTICNFKKECKELIESTFKKTVRIAKALGIVTLGHISTDGSKLKANASKKLTLSKEEDKLYGDKRGDELPPERRNTQKTLQEKIKEIEQASGKRLKSAAKQIIEQHVLGDDKDQFISPNGEILTRKGEYEYKGKLQYTYYGANCGECPIRSECAGEGKRRVITSDDCEAERRRMADKMQSEGGEGGVQKA